jgi:hypothetical protein
MNVVSAATIDLVTGLIRTTLVIVETSAGRQLAFQDQKACKFCRGN